MVNITANVEWQKNRVIPQFEKKTEKEILIFAFLSMSTRLNQFLGVNPDK